MKNLLAALLLTASAHANNANLTFDRDRDLQEIIILEYEGHFYEIERVEHSWHCPCRESNSYSFDYPWCSTKALPAQNGK